MAAEVESVRNRLAGLLAAAPRNLVTPQNALLLLLVAGALLRVLRLDALGDFDFDEVAAIWYARSSPGDILAAVARAPFEHPPLYYIGLHYWTSWFGEAEPVARALSIPLGLLLIPVTYRLARCYLSPWAAVVLSAWDWARAGRSWATCRRRTPIPFSPCWARRWAFWGAYS